MITSRGVFILTIVILFSINISASCGEGQVDINSAPAEELDEIVYIGPVRAQEIIILRPFSSVDDMIRIKGIGEVYLQAIKDQGLACVEDGENGEDSEDDETEDIEENINESSVTSDNIISEGGGVDDEEISAPAEREAIILNPQVIKTDEDTGELNKTYAISGFIAFCILICVLFMIKNKKDKNEFR